MVVIFSILLGLLILRLLLPHVALYFINRKLSRLRGYNGQIEAVAMNLFRGSYTLHDIVLRKTDAKNTGEPFFMASRVELLIQWKALFKKSVIATVVVVRPELMFTKDKKESGGEIESTSSLKTILQRVWPFAVNLGIRDGTIHYLDTTHKATIDLEITELAVCVREFGNMPRHQVSPAHITASARIYEGTFDFAMKLYPMTEHLTFDMNAEVKNINMVLLNGFFRTYARIDVNEGRFGMYTEVAAAEGGFKGYVKPVIQDLDIVGMADRNDSLLTKLWERFVAGMYQLIKNKKEDQLAAKIPIEGRFDDPHINVFIALVTIFQNAFVRAIHPSIDDVINIASVHARVSKAKKFVTAIFRRKQKV
jgi:hypothetical protein